MNQTTQLNKNAPAGSAGATLTGLGENHQTNYTPTPDEAQRGLAVYLAALPPEQRAKLEQYNTQMITEALTTETPADAPDPREMSLPATAYMPELPHTARLSEAEYKKALSVGLWVDRYVEFANLASPMTPALFHRSYGLALLATAIARRVYVQAGDELLYPNLYMLLVAPSTLYAKTTGLNVGLKLLDMAGLSNFLLPTGVTPQSLVTELTNRVPQTFGDWSQDDKADWQKERQFAAQRAWWMDEAASLLDLFKQKNTADLLGMILKLYGSPSKLTASTVGRGRETVRYPYLSICGPTTPAAMRNHLKNSELWGDGLFARFLFVTPDTAPVDAFYQPKIEMPAGLAEHLNKMAFLRLELPKENMTNTIQPPPAIQAILASGVFEKWKAYKSGIFDLLVKEAVPEKLFALYGRLHTTAIKIAMLLATSDFVEMAEGNPLIIRSEHWARAQIMTEEYRASLHRLVENASHPIDDEDQELAERIIKRISTTTRNSRRELAQDLHMAAGMHRSHLDLIINQLIADGRLEERDN